MRFLSKNCPEWWAVVGMLPLLASCAFAPGMRMATGAEPAPVVDSAETPGVTPVFKAITPQLLQAENTLREQDVNPDLSPLIAQPTPYLIGSGDIISIVVWN